MFFFSLYVFFLPNEYYKTIADPVRIVNGNKTAITTEVLPLSLRTDKRYLA